MSNHEPQIRATELYNGEAIRAAELESTEILSSVVPGSRLHQVIHNPSTAESTRAESKSVGSCRKLSDRSLRRLRNAIARRKLQDLHDEKVLQSWLAEVWEQPARRVATGDTRMPVR